MHTTFRQFPENPGVHCAKQQFSSIRTAAIRIHLIENPGQLRCWKISVNDQACFFQQFAFPFAALDVLAQIRCTAALPNNGVVHWLSCHFIPHNGGLALVRDTNGFDIIRMNVGNGQQLLQNTKGRSPQFHRIFFHPAWLWIILTDFLLTHSNDGLRMVKRNRACTGGSDI